MRHLTVVLAALVALPLAAATRYTLSGETTGRLRSHLQATVLAEGHRRRIDFVREETPFPFDVLLSDDGGATFTALNTQLKTWFRGPQAMFLRAHIYQPMPGARRKSVRDLSVTTSDEPSEPIGGLAARKYVVKVSFTVRQDLGQLVDEHFGSTILVWTTDAVDASLGMHAGDLTTGVPEVDALLAPALAKIPGFPLKTTQSATRHFTGGQPQTSTFTATVSDIRTVDAPPHAFEVPADYVNQPPVIGAPVR
jgi:hypothetical protein